MPDTAASLHPFAVSGACCEGHEVISAGESVAGTTEPAPWAGEVAYVLMGFPRLSESFISQEIHLLESLGARLRLYAVKRGEDARRHESVDRIRAPLTYLPPVTSLSGTGLFAWLRRNVRPYFRHHARVIRRRPLAWLTTMASAVSMCWRYRAGPFAAPRKVFVKEFLQAGYIAAEVLQQPGVRHLHGHFCHGATTVTWFASRMAGLPFSFTAHAKDIYQADQNPGDLLRRKLRAAIFAATCTEANRRHLAARHPEGHIVRTVYHGLDTNYWSPEHARRNAGAVPTLLAVGRLVEKKGFAYLVDACARLRDSGRPFRLLIVGEPGDRSDAIHRRIAELRLGSLVTLQGPVTHTELRDLYARADVFVLPCLVAADGDRDGIPNVLAEAMAMALPVVTTGVSGIPELVRASRDGLVVPEKDAGALAEALAKLLDDGELRSRLGLAARRRILQVFDAKTTTRSLAALFEQAMARAEVAR